MRYYIVEDFEKESIKTGAKVGFSVTPMFSHANQLGITFLLVACIVSFSVGQLHFQSFLFIVISGKMNSPKLATPITYTRSIGPKAVR
jgi:hypothetical protein